MTSSMYGKGGSKVDWGPIHTTNVPHLQVSGHRIGTAEVENALDEHHDVAESAVIGVDHVIKGQGIYAYVVLKEV